MKLIDLINEIEDQAICFKLDSIIDDMELLKKKELQNERYFELLFKSILFEQQPLHA